MSGPVLVEVDHLAYLTERAHRRLVHAAIRRCARKRRSGVMRVLHEADYSCCAREAWEITAARLHGALSDDGEVVAWALVDQRAAAVLLPGKRSA